jgi:hypothetical protein
MTQATKDSRHYHECSSPAICSYFIVPSRQLKLAVCSQFSETPRVAGPGTRGTTRSRLMFCTKVVSGTVGLAS